MFAIFIILSAALFNLVNSITICSESYQCTYSSNITSINDNSIWCSGYQSCSNTLSLIANPLSLECDGAYSCSNVDTITSATTLECSALCSCCNISLINTNHRFKCFGERSCENSTLNATTTVQLDDDGVECLAHRSCSDSIIINDGNGNILGQGSLSLSNSMVINSDESDVMNVYFYGYHVHVC